MQHPARQLRSLRSSLSLFTVAALAASVGHAQTVEKLVDLNPTPWTFSSSPTTRDPITSGDLLPILDGWVYFNASNELGRELYRAQARVGSIERIADIRPGAESSNPLHLAVAGSNLFFTADDGVHGREVWRTDGTTATLVADLTPGPAGTSFAQFPAAGMGGQFYFVCDTGAGAELHVSDGTAGGTRQVKDINPGTSGSGINFIAVTAAGDQIIFSANDGVHGREAWVSDGTEAGTRMLLDAAPGSVSGNPAHYYNFDGSTYFGAVPNSDLSRLYKTDGTSVEVIYSFNDRFASPPNPQVTFQGRMWFRGRLASTTGWQIYVTDGTPGNTGLFSDPATNPVSSTILSPTVSSDGQTLYAATPNLLFVSDGTVAGTGNSNPSAGSIARPSQFFALADAVYGQMNLSDESGDELVRFRPDGTAEVVKEINPGPEGSRITSTTVLDGKGIFAATDTLNGVELWMTDGTTEGTVLIGDIDTRARTGFAEMSPAIVNLGRRGVFAATDGVRGRELWSTDGTAEGTRLIDALPGAEGIDPDEIAAFGTIALFGADDGVHGRELWCSDGRRIGTAMIADINLTGDSLPADFVTLDRVAYFTADDGVSGRELWRTDGTRRGTRCVADALPGIEGSDPTDLTVVGPYVYFAATDAAGDRELWRTDGTTDGTERVLDVNPTDSSRPSELVAVGEALYFKAIEGFGEKVFRWDGASIVAATDPSGAEIVFARELVALDGKLFLMLRGSELWSVEGTAATLVQDMSDTIRNLSAVGNRLILGNGPVNSAIWVSDGTAAGTEQVSDGQLSEAFAVGNHIYFSTWFGRGPEYDLYRTDGTLAGTTLLGDFFDGSRELGRFAHVGGKLLFVGDDDDSREALFGVCEAGATAEPFGLACGLPAPTISSEAPVLGSVFRVRASGPEDASVVRLKLGYPYPTQFAYDCQFYTGWGSSTLVCNYGSELDVLLRVSSSPSLIGRQLVLQAEWIRFGSRRYQWSTSQGLMLTLDDD